MSRFPKLWTETNAEQDANNWAHILKDYLQVSLASDGKIGTLSSDTSRGHRLGSGSDFVEPTNTAWGFAYSGVITPGLNNPGYGIICAPNFTKATSGTHGQLVGFEADFPHITNPSAGGVVTDLVAIRVGADAAPTGGTNMYAIQVMNGKCLFGGLDADSSNPAVGLSNNRMVSWKDSLAAYTNAAFITCDTSNRLAFGVGNTSSLWLHPVGVGILTLGTSTSTNMLAGDARLAGALWIADGTTAPTQQAGFACIYIDVADGDLKIKYADGVTKVIAADT